MATTQTRGGSGVTGAVAKVVGLAPRIAAPVNREALTHAPTQLQRRLDLGEGIAPALVDQLAHRHRLRIGLRWAGRVRPHLDDVLRPLNKALPVRLLLGPVVDRPV